MLFLAHCSFDEPGRHPSFGYFTFLVKARDLETARERLRDEIGRAREESDLFDGRVTIYLDDFIAVPRLPSRGFIGRYQAYLGKTRGEISCSLPAGSPRDCVLYENGTDDSDEEDEDELETTFEPFVTYRAKRPKE